MDDLSSVLTFYHVKHILTSTVTAAVIYTVKVKAK